MEQIIELIRHLPEHLQIWATAYGSGLYFILAAIIFAETGLVLAPILPGDSLLFAAGAVIAMKIPGLSLWEMCVVLILATFCGDLTNYHVGQWLAPKIFSGTRVRWLNRKHLEKTQAFYARHGGKTVVMARFIPIVRTYAPFVAGMSGFPLRRFVAFSLSGATLWISGFLSLGYFFGNIPAVQKNFELVILAIILVSLTPVAVEFLRSRRQR